MITDHIPKKLMTLFSLTHLLVITNQCHHLLYPYITAIAISYHPLILHHKKRGCNLTSLTCAFRSHVFSCGYPLSSSAPLICAFRQYRPSY